MREANEEWKESGSSAYRNGKNGEIGGGWTRRSNAAGGETKAKLARGSETVVLLIGRKGRMEMEILDRFFVKGENDSDVENYRSGYAISFI